MSYIKENLLPNEKILFTAQIHPAVFLPSFVSFVMTIVLFINGLSTLGIFYKENQMPSQTTNVNLAGILLLCFCSFLFLYSMLLFFQAVIVMFTTEFAVTNRRIIAKTGFIRRHTLEMFLLKIESVSVNQNIIGRLLNFGTVTVTGTGGTEESFRGIINPIGIRKRINQTIESYIHYQQKQSNRQEN